MAFGLLAPKTFKIIWFSSFSTLSVTWWRLFQKRVVRTNFDINVFIHSNVIKFYKPTKNHMAADLVVDLDLLKLHLELVKETMETLKSVLHVVILETVTRAIVLHLEKVI